MSNNRKEEIFKCQCPVFDCTNTKVINWHHYGCSAIWGLYISIKQSLDVKIAEK